MRSAKSDLRSRVRDLLRQRRMNVSRLAEQAGVSRCHLSEALANKPLPQGGVRGGVIRKRVAPLLTAEELALLGWS